MRKAVALLIVASLILLSVVTLSFYYFALRSYIDRVEGAIDKTLAYYLCESGLSVAIGRYYNNHQRAGTIIIPLPYRQYRYKGFTISPRNYTVHFKVESQQGVSPEGTQVTTGRARFKVWISSPRGFKNRTYYLEASAQRAFPIFIRGKP